MGSFCSPLPRPLYHIGLRKIVLFHYRSVSIATMELQKGVLSTLAECYLGEENVFVNPA